MLLAALAATSACGGGDGGGAGNVVTNPPPGNWQQGVFMDRASFEAKCQAPRSGTNPATGMPYSDVQGSTLDENNVLAVAAGADTLVAGSVIYKSDDPARALQDLRSAAAGTSAGEGAATPVGNRA
jgi:hypothetical protein